MKITNDTAAIVTGGASGLGEGTARRLAAEGAKVALFDLNAERGEAVAAELGGVFCQVNVADAASVEAGFAKAGNPELYPEFERQFPTAEVAAVKIDPGERFDWMLFRKNSTGPVTTVKDVIWEGEEAFDAYRFSIDKDDQRSLPIDTRSFGYEFS